MTSSVVNPVASICITVFCASDGDARRSGAEREAATGRRTEKLGGFRQCEAYGGAGMLPSSGDGAKFWGFSVPVPRSKAQN